MKIITFKCCMNCAKRHIGCHSTCDLYLKTKAEIDAARECKIKATDNWHIAKFGKNTKTTVRL